MDEPALTEERKETSLPPPIGRRLRRLSRAAGAALLASGLGRLLAAAEIFLFSTLALDRIFELERGFRAVLLAAGAAAWAALLWRSFLKPLLSRIPEVELALALERSHPFLRQALVSALQLSRRLASGAPEGGESPALARKAVEEGARLAAGTRTARALEWRRLRVRLLLLPAALAVLAGSFAAMPGTLALWAQRQILLRDTPWPRYTTLEILGAKNGVLYTPMGEDLVVLVRARGVIPARGWISWESKKSSGRARLARLGRDRFRYLFKTLTDPLTFTVRAGDGRAGPVRAVPVKRPSVLALEGEIREPAYTGRRPAKVDIFSGGGALRLLAGSSLLLRGRADKKLSAAGLGFPGGSLPGEVDPGDPRKFSFTLEPRENMVLRILPVDELGLEPRPAPTIEVAVVPDAPPWVSLASRGVGSMVTPRVRIPLLVKARDDVALSVLEVQQSLGGSNPENRNFTKAAPRGLEAFEPGAPSFEAEVLWVRGSTPLSPGKTLSLRALARDRFAPGPPHQAFSEVLEFKVVPEEVLRKELNRRQEEVRSQLEGLQESLRALRKDLEARPGPEQGLPGELQGDAARAGGAARRLSGILDEWENNRLAGWERVPALREMVVSPLREKAVPALGKGAEDAAAWQAAARGALPALKKDVDRALEALARVLSNLTRMESFQQVLEITRSLLRTQGKAREALKKKIEKSLDELFGGKKR